MSLNSPVGRVRVLCRRADLLDPLDQRVDCGLALFTGVRTPCVQPVLLLLVQERLNGLVPHAVVIGMKHALESRYLCTAKCSS